MTWNVEPHRDPPPTDYSLAREWPEVLLIIDEYNDLADRHNELGEDNDLLRARVQRLEQLLVDNEISLPEDPGSGGIEDDDQPSEGLQQVNREQIDSEKVEPARKTITRPKANEKKVRQSSTPQASSPRVGRGARQQRSNLSSMQNPDDFGNAFDALEDDNPQGMLDDGAVLSDLYQDQSFAESPQATFSTQRSRPRDSGYATQLPASTTKRSGKFGRNDDEDVDHLSSEAASSRRRETLSRGFSGNGRDRHVVQPPVHPIKRSRDPESDEDEDEHGSSSKAAPSQHRAMHTGALRGSKTDRRASRPSLSTTKTAWSFESDEDEDDLRPRSEAAPPRAPSRSNQRRATQSSGSTRKKPGLKNSMLSEEDVQRAKQKNVRPTKKARVEESDGESHHQSDSPERDSDDHVLDFFATVKITRAGSSLVKHEDIPAGLQNPITALINQIVDKQQEYKPKASSWKVLARKTHGTCILQYMQDTGTRWFLENKKHVVCRVCFNAQRPCLRYDETTNHYYLCALPDFARDGEARPTDAEYFINDEKNGSSKAEIVEGKKLWKQ